MSVYPRISGLVVLAALWIHFLHSNTSAAEPQVRPNILWITSEDNGPQLGCYGDNYSNTPNIDRLASKSLRYLNCWSNAPVCAPARTTIITGMWPTSLGAQHMRSEVRLPSEVSLFPQLLRGAGYYCTNNSKEDYNLLKPGKIWDESSNKAHWRNRKPGQPFFSVFNFTTTHESQIRKRPHAAKHDPAKVIVPPYHPDLPEVRQDWAQYYDQIEEMDGQVGKVLQELQKDGLTENTIVFYFGDHGSGMPRSKRWLYQSGLHVPLLIHIPERFQSLAGDSYRSGETSEELVGFIDLAPTILSLAGIDLPKYLQGRAILGPQRGGEPDYMIGFRDRMDECYDCSRAVRDRNYLYIRNWIPYRPQGQFLEYMFETPTTVAWQKAFESGQTDASQSFFWRPKPSEELYDIANDPYQTRNLATDKDSASILEAMRQRLRDWTLQSRDLGLMHEGDFHQLADGKPPRDVGLDSQLYPLAEIFDSADHAVRIAQQPHELKMLLQHSDHRIRYWGLHGLLTQMSRNTPVDVEMVLPLVDDPSPINAALAGEIVSRIDSSTERHKAIEKLLVIATSSDVTYFARLQALLALDFADAAPQELETQLKKMPPAERDLPKRYESYVDRMLSRLKSKK